MVPIALRYTAERLTDKTFDANAPQQQLFNPVKVTDWIIEKAEVSGILLNGRRYSHLLYYHKTIDVVISADEIDNNTLQFLQDFWIGKFKYIAIKLNLTDWDDYKEIVTEGGKFPLSYIDDLRELKEVAFSFKTTGE